MVTVKRKHKCKGFLVYLGLSDIGRIWLNIAHKGEADRGAKDKSQISN